MTTTKTSGAATRVSVRTPDKPVVLFSDEASAVTTAGFAGARQLPRPLDTLTWQEPPALEEPAVLDETA
ncbi:hypothetical protein [Streptomyces sp. NPDC089919]|uniref:hypothetical protein n=1 Tax=Streptomyces sp. NPDC089919 TaxID=3155188 RepID=UPI00341DC5FB